MSNTPKCLNSYNDFKVNDTVYIYHSLAKPEPFMRGRITIIHENDDFTVSFFVEWETGGGSWAVPEHVFKTKYDVLDYIERQKDAEKNKYKVNIRSFDDLIDFCIQTITYTNDPDYAAIAAIKEKYEELKSETSETMITPVGILPINADGMKTVVSELNKLRTKLNNIRKCCDND